MARAFKPIEAENADDAELSQLPDESPVECQLCGRRHPHLVRHHLIPRSRQDKSRLRREFTRQEMRSRIAHLCPDCQSHLHRNVGEKELALNYNTLETLRNAPGMDKFLPWIRRQRVA